MHNQSIASLLHFLLISPHIQQYHLVHYREIMYHSGSHDALQSGGTAAAVPPPFRPSEPALCGSCPLVTPYYCRLEDLLCLFV